MHNSLKLLLEKAEKNLERKKKNSTHITGVILGCKIQEEDEIMLTHHIRNLKSYVNEVLISIPEGKEITDEKLKIELRDFSIKLIERSSDSDPYSLKVFSHIINQSINDKLFVLSNHYKISKNQIKQIFSQDVPLVSFLGQNGNSLPFILLYDKWVNRFFLQILIINERSSLYDLFRIVSDKLFYKIPEEESITYYKNNTNNTNLKSKKEIYLTLRVQCDFNIQDLVKMIALMQVVKKEFSEDEKTHSTFKIQQLLTLSKKFVNQGNCFLSYQIPYFFECVKSEKIKFPVEWSQERIEKMGIDLLLKESDLYKKKGLNRLFYQVLLDKIECEKFEVSVLNQFKKDKANAENLLRKDNIPFFE
jgi:hypothetical protein